MADPQEGEYFIEFELGAKVVREIGPFAHGPQRCLMTHTQDISCKYHVNAIVHLYMPWQWLSHKILICVDKQKFKAGLSICVSMK